MSKVIPLSNPALNGTELSYVKEAFDTNWVAPIGPNVDGFEAELSAYLGASHVLALSSGTAAIHLALKALGISDGDIVFCTDMTFAATCNPIKYERALPVFIDSEPSTWNMCPKALEAAFKKYPGAKAVIAVNLYGTPARLDEISSICKKYDAKLIEDAAESLGSTYKGIQTGRFGDIGILSFNGNKIITTSGGGALICEDEAVTKKARFWSTQSRDPARHYQHSELGYNYRMSNICAGIGRAQLTTLDLRVEQKTAIYERYKAALCSNEFISINPVTESSKPNHWLSCITLANGCHISYISIIEKLDSEGIETRPLWKPMSMQPYYSDCDFVFVSEKPIGPDLFSRGLCLPSDVNMTIEQQSRVCDIILEMFS